MGPAADCLLHNLGQAQGATLATKQAGRLHEFDLARASYRETNTAYVRRGRCYGADKSAGLLVVHGPERPDPAGAEQLRGADLAELPPPGPLP
jgi:hypothetical protein